MLPWCGQEQLALLKFLNIHDQKLQTEIHAKYVHYTFTEHYSFSVLFLAFRRFLSSFFFPFSFYFSVGIECARSCLSPPPPPSFFLWATKRKKFFLFFVFISRKTHKNPKN